jgi:DNA-binding transcriptional regulator GbsR (MarR family)
MSFTANEITEPTGISRASVCMQAIMSMQYTVMVICVFMSS